MVVGVHHNRFAPLAELDVDVTHVGPVAGSDEPIDLISGEFCMGCAFDIFVGPNSVKVKHMAATYRH